MNFYTLTFKQKVIISLLSIGVLMVGFNILLGIFVDLKTTKNSFINEKQSKIKHFKLNSPTSKEIIFVGSSKTFYHISTNSFKKRGIDVYNIGISGVFFTGYPTLVAGILEPKPQKVVISLGVERLYSKLSISKYPSIDEIKIYFDIDKMKFVESLYRWLINRNTFLVHSEPIFFRVKEFYSRFEVKSNNETKAKKSIDYSQIADCNVFDIKKTNSQHSMLKCSNGDGILIGNYLQEIKDNHKKLQILNQESVKYLKAIISMIESHNIEPIIILEPQLHNRLEYNIDDIYKTFVGVDVIDLTNFPIEDKFWADNKHLNYKGREIYSEYLSTILLLKGDKNNQR